MPCWRRASRRRGRAATRLAWVQMEENRVIEELFAQVSYVDIFNFCVFLVFTVCYSYQLYYVFHVLTHQVKPRVAKRDHRYAVVICARNEAAVIGDLIHSIRVNNYPQHLIDIFVVADNCTDNTAMVAQRAGAIVFPRFNRQYVGKGYALTYGFKCIKEQYGHNGYEAYFVFDADNVLDVNYFREMNATFDNGALASTSYRNSKNYDSNWISAGYAVWFLRECKYLSQARLLLDTSCAISGTGFFIAAEVIDRAGGWKWHLLTEDIEFSAQTILNGEQISYTPTAMLYDEQPVTFRDSWNQRFRWAKGFYQVFGRYGWRLAKGIFTNPKGRRFACFDMLMTIAPGMLLTIVALTFNILVVVFAALGLMSTGVAVATSISSVFFCVFNYTLIMFAFGVLATFTEWDNIDAPASHKIRYMFTFPAFMLTYIPIALVALVKRAEWKPIAHTISVDVESFAAGERKMAA